ncbi:hypothetical protein M422DRAFT_22691 [Sphaerobolus stellatus SS14]|nr:hypothetical protein M422DRAFT_22691 [Sphaerobolus stellatus SS14]
MSSKYTSLYIGAATNRNSHAADIDRESSVVCFACQHLLGLWNVLDKGDSGIFTTLPGHQANINCVKFLDGQTLASGDQAGVLQIRKYYSNNWKLVFTKQTHELNKPISTLAVSGCIIVTGSSDSTVKIWRINNSNNEGVGLEHVQTLNLKGRFPLDVRLVSFPDSPCLILAIASTSKDVEIWSGTPETQFVHTASLTGHEDWVKALAFVKSNGSPAQLTLASGSQDGTIRLWTIDETAAPRVTTSKDDIFDAFEASLGEFAEGEEGGRQMSAKRHIMAVRSLSGDLYHFSLTFDALLVGHEAGITSLSWMPEHSSSQHGLTLLSTSVDSSLILWSSANIPDSNSSGSSSAIWINQQRFGDVGGQRFGGFIGGLWADQGKEALAWGWNGGWRRWQSLSLHGDPRAQWQEKGAITGHQGIVKSVAWDSRGDYILSTGLDQTSRIHGPCRQYPKEFNGGEVWHELARPQIHGYDTVGAEFLTPLRFVSIADEKVARVFDAPQNFVSTLNSLGTFKTAVDPESRPVAANVPPLGLSNKAIDDDANISDIPILAPNRRPFEGELAAITLWPEIEKIFGHGYELVSLATSHSGSLFATACKSTSVDHAGIRIYSTHDWQLVGDPLLGHKLTITRIVFSPDDTLILSVSRDRTWRLFKANAQNGDFAALNVAKAHERIIWDCAWAKETSSRTFATASRDKTVKIWQPADDNSANWTNAITLTFKEAATAVDFSPVLSDGCRRLAIGLENGDIYIYSQNVSETQGSWKQELIIEKQHVASVTRLSWRPSGDKASDQQLASCSEDGTIRLIGVHLNFY